MIRVIDEHGVIAIGLCRSYIEALLAGERCCVPGDALAPHVCLFFAEDDGALVELTKELYPAGLLPGAHLNDAAREAFAKGGEKG